MTPETEVGEQAIAWHIRLRDGDDAAWDGFIEWLSADAAHQAAYDRIELADADITPLLPEIVVRTAANDAGEPGEAPRGRRWWLGGAAASLAAALVAVVTVGPHYRAAPYEIATGPGETRTVTLDPATRVTLNGSSRMAFDHNDARIATLVGGEALFEVRHDPKAPFTVSVGDNRIVDVGTTFNVARGVDAVRVEVAEGEILYNPDGEAVALRPGQALADPEAGGAIRVTAVPADAIGGWRDGRLVYAAAPLSQVAEDLARVLGTRIAIDPAIAARPFSGAIAVDHSGAGQLRRLMPALDVTLEAGPGGWTMRPRAAR